jgi:phage-related protein (TIGR01555 family)
MNLDGWKNLVTGLSTAADKAKKTKPIMTGVIPDVELESIYMEDGLGTRIVNLLPDDMFREGWEYEFPDKDDEVEITELSDQYNEVLDKIGALGKIREAFYWARLYGGAVILIGALDGQELDVPLKPKRIRSFEYLRVIDRSDIQYAQIEWQLDPLQERYCQPVFYPIRFTTPMGTQETRRVHYSRIIELHGSLVPVGATSTMQLEQRYWGVSVLQNVIDKLSITGSSIGSIGHLLDEFSVGKYKLSDLEDILSQDDGDILIQKRMQVMDLCRSVFHSMYFGPNDDFIRENIQFTGIPDILYILFMLVSACTGYPITRLFGVSPGGMNATGESDMRNYYDAVRSDQKAEAEPVVLRIIRIISEWKNLPEPYIKWRPLQSPSPKEKAEIEKLEADTQLQKAATYKAWIDAGIMEPYEARYLEFGDTLDKIPVPEDMLPPVETVSEEENNEGKEGAESENANESEQKGEDAGEGSENNDPNGKEGEKPDEDGNDPDGEGNDESELKKKVAAMDKKEVAARIKELEAEKEPSDEEAAELKLLEARLIEIKGEEDTAKKENK